MQMYTYVSMYICIYVRMYIQQLSHCNQLCVRLQLYIHIYKEVLYTLAFGLLFQPLGEEGVQWHTIKLYFNLYTGPGFLGALLGIINIVVVVILFKEYNVQGGVKKRLHFSRLWHYCLSKCRCKELNSEETKPLIDKENKGIAIIQ